MRPLPCAALGAALIALVVAACSDSSTDTDRGSAPITAPADNSTRPTADGPRVVTADLVAPVGVAWRSGDPLVYVAEQDGRVVAVGPDGRVGRTPVLEIEVTSGGEQGLLGLAFSADGNELYTYVTDPDGDTRVDAWSVGPGRIDRASRRTLLTVDQPFVTHNGGGLVVGPDGLLYIGLGDGGGAGDPGGNAQDPNSLLGKIVRVDPRARPPRPEIFMSGLRNPWRFSFDRETGSIWIGDVGQSAVEEIDTAPAGESGVNWGWDRLEGTRTFEGEAPTDARAPILEIPHGPACSVIGGYVYRGRARPELRGRYVYGDFCDPTVRAFAITRGRAGSRTEVASIDELTSFGEDPDGELWATSGRGELVRLTGS